MVFENTSDYLCYVEAVHMLYKEKVKKDCEFRQKKDDESVEGDYYEDIQSKTFVNSKFLNKQDKVREYFFVLDNTDWPQALSIPDLKDWDAPEHGIGADPTTTEGDIHVRTYTKLKFTSSDKYQVWSSLFTIIFVTLGVVALVSFLFFLRMTCVYQNYALERRELKRALINLKDTEYANFLLD